jgi:uncharacterized SAM-binding protein YcdF (DUF218 family)
MDLYETLGRFDPETLSFTGGVIGGLARELIRWRKLAMDGTAAIFAQPLFLGLAGVEVMLGAGVATLAHAYTPNLAPPLALLTAFLLGAGFEEIIKHGARLIPSADPPLGADRLKPTIGDFLRS